MGEHHWVVVPALQRGGCANRIVHGSVRGNRHTGDLQSDGLAWILRHVDLHADCRSCPDRRT